MPPVHNQDSFDSYPTTPGKQIKQRPDDYLSLSDEEDLTPFQYARFHGLTTDHRRTQLEIPRLPTPQSESDCLANSPRCLNVTELDSLEAPDGTTIGEKWVVDREAAAYLASIVKAQEDDTLNIDAAFPYESLWQLKIEEAISPIDPAFDLDQLKQRNVLNLSIDGQVPSDVTIDVLWTPQELRLPAEMDLKIAQQRLDVDVETMLYLKSVHDPEPVAESVLVEAHTKVCDL